MDQQTAMSAADASAETVSELRSRSLLRTLAPVAILLALLSAALTFFVILGLTPIAVTQPRDDERTFHLLAREATEGFNVHLHDFESGQQSEAPFTVFHTVGRRAS